ncbi:calcium/sodium antiporter [Serpentinicella sp. ANB-PHB4]|uniref:calcium/sodium antiporter n=1 Tax=Serpentinicella sp. ANB-PHB4 TaxID=3074076 RepID=UPI00285F04B8|nr:calcium/sodium antiporter [Serpentinicella sp. ANB-PHB4]MDR5658044.1 calcium/sodium antiporter [Serpentinicella sp. ANB-PHB4]
MENILIVVLFIIGLITIIKGGDWFVDAAVWLAKVTGVPNVFIGSTIVSVATTLPELFVSSIATYQEHYDVALGNVVGSIVCNIGLVLGITALLAPINLKQTTFKTKSLFMLISCLLLLFFVRDTILSSTEGSILIIVFLIYIFISVLEYYKNEKTQKKSKETVVSTMVIAKNIGKFCFGAIFITVGAKLLVDNGVALANIIGVPEQIVSLTLIALGTSLPELTTAISSIIKKEAGISIGNILGANILNIVMVLGISSKISGRGIFISFQNVMIGTEIYAIPQTLYFDIPVALLLMIILFIGGLIFKKVNRIMGFLLITTYILYIGALAKFFL